MRGSGHPTNSVQGNLQKNVELLGFNSSIKETRSFCFGKQRCRINVKKCFRDIIHIRHAVQNMFAVFPNSFSNKTQLYTVCAWGLMFSSLCLSIYTYTFSCFQFCLSFYRLLIIFADNLYTVKSRVQARLV